MKAGKFGLAVAFVMFACSANGQDFVTKEYDPFREVTTYNAGFEFVGNFTSDISEEDDARFFLRGFHFHNPLLLYGPYLVQLYVALKLSDDYSLNHAWVLGDRSPREITKIRSDVSCETDPCLHYEQLGIWLSEAELERGRREGLSVQFSGYGTVSFSIPEWYFMLFLDTWEKRGEEG